MSGTTSYPLTERMRDSIAVHGLRWAVHYYGQRMTRYELRVLLASAYCGSAK